MRGSGKSSGNWWKEQHSQSTNERLGKAKRAVGNTKNCWLIQRFRILQMNRFGTPMVLHHQGTVVRTKRLLGVPCGTWCRTAHVQVFTCDCHDISPRHQRAPIRCTWRANSALVPTKANKANKANQANEASKANEANETSKADKTNGEPTRPGDQQADKGQRATRAQQAAN